ncbi:hypothetical protein G6F57_006775 [Rhizopus arrhizus]|uniref:Centromere protein S n=1 Tax=Rhizopus oryzae TaxID=64495 RepID=A0A9P7BVA2_RHIOR|nr:hypothetical protein G6F23_002278 [Rhizopus arrhizus]KAG1421776.1 hypothetical protein G6F58_003601 [Rhizopus delemar]KAG0762223.1 hypothetical protein G6F24_006961 [Rhizopus arrhizus]KAG0791555.1 hypothetical protein G6F22_006107 [Rhizopus arrhizus]KAG0794814.1 hypothetical protein G6F21_002585 [Rhizopus arrhizus]
MDDDNEILAALLYNVREIVGKEARSLGKEASPEFIVSLTEVLSSQIKTMAQDLESFAKHGRRSVISMEDVKLCARRNDTLYETISELAKDITEETSSKRRRK